MSLMEQCRYDAGCWRPLRARAARWAARWAALWSLLAEQEEYEEFTIEDTQATVSSSKQSEGHQGSNCCTRTTATSSEKMDGEIDTSVRHRSEALISDTTAETRQGTFDGIHDEGTQITAFSTKQNKGHTGSNHSTRITATSSERVHGDADTSVRHRSEVLKSERTEGIRQGTFVNSHDEGTKNTVSSAKQNGGHQGSNRSTSITATSSERVHDDADTSVRHRSEVLKSERTEEIRQGTFANSHDEGTQNTVSSAKQNGGHQGPNPLTRTTATSSAGVDGDFVTSVRPSSEVTKSGKTAETCQGTVVSTRVEEYMRRFPQMTAKEAEYAAVNGMFEA